VLLPVPAERAHNVVPTAPRRPAEAGS